MFNYCCEHKTRMSHISIIMMNILAIKDIIQLPKIFTYLQLFGLCIFFAKRQISIELPQPFFLFQWLNYITTYKIWRRAPVWNMIYSPWSKKDKMGHTPSSIQQLLSGLENDLKKVGRYLFWVLPSKALWAFLSQLKKIL